MQQQRFIIPSFISGRQVNGCISAVCFFIFLLAGYGASAQKQSYSWFFGTNAGITFATNPASAIPGGKITAEEGCASISDTDGSLLFYTDGATVWNKNHAVMDNGTGLLGQSSSTQSAIIVKLPGSSTLFYVFTTPEQDNGSGYRYSVVDISLNANAGKVISKNNVILKDFSDPLSAFTESTEAMTACYDKAKQNFWIIMKETVTSDFYAYKLTAAGLQAPVVSSVGILEDHLSQCRISPDGSKLAVGKYFGNGVELFDFNNETGVISNTRWFMRTNTERVYGLSFSPDSKLLYVTNGISELFQFDVSSGVEATIAASQTKIATGSAGYFPEIQLGPDNRLYMAQPGKDYIAVVEYPNVLGTGCSFIDKGVLLTSGTTSRLGLPSFMVNYVTSPTAQFTSPRLNLLPSQAGICAGESVRLDAVADGGVTYRWYKDKVLISTEKEPVVNKGGQYILEAQDSFGNVAKDTIEVIENKVPLTADFLMTSEATLANRIVAVDISYPKPDSVRWNWGSATALQEDDKYVLTFPSAGTYVVHLTSYLGLCIKTAERTVKISGVTPVQDQLIYPALYDLQAGPNPTNGIVQVMINSLSSETIVLEVYDMNGKHLLTESMNTAQSNKASIDLGPFPKGTYLITVISGDHRRTIQIVKQ